MVLGHCHYSDDEKDKQNKDFTIGVVEDYIKWIQGGRKITRDEKGNIIDRWVYTFENFSAALLGCYYDSKEVESVWNRIIYYNYVQVAVDAYNSKPTSKNYKDSIEGFKSVLSKYKPDIIIAWGGVYEKTPALGGKDIETIEADGVRAKCYQYLLSDGKPCKMIKIHHPSMCFSWEKWHKVLEKVISVD